jgi:hypothetical protein
MSPTCLRLLLVVHILVVVHSTPNHPPQFTFSVQESMSKAQLVRVLDPKVAYNVAYQWNRFGQIKDWAFEEEDAQDRPGSMHGMQCTRARFIASLMLPKSFQEYLPVQAAYSIHMHKKLCLQNLVITEFSRVEDVYFFTDFNLIEISRLHNDSITTDVEVYYNVPWYLMFLKANINAYLEQSIKDRLRIMYQTLREG